MVKKKAYEGRHFYDHKGLKRVLVIHMKPRLYNLIAKLAKQTSASSGIRQSLQSAARTILEKYFAER